MFGRLADQPPKGQFVDTARARIVLKHPFDESDGQVVAVFERLDGRSADRHTQIILRCSKIRTRKRDIPVELVQRIFKWSESSRGGLSSDHRVNAPADF